MCSEAAGAGKACIRCKIRGAVSMNIAVKDSKRSNIAATKKRLKTVSQRRVVNKTKSFSFHPVQ